VMCVWWCDVFGPPSHIEFPINSSSNSQGNDNI
jgi:hypothetical protein